MNCKNANQELGFDNFSECDYNLHWSFSNFNRMLMAAGQIARLPWQSCVLELGAGSSELEVLVHKNFKRNDIKFVKVDGDKQYESNESITVLDITSSQGWETIITQCKEFDAVVLMEVIEHVPKEAQWILDRIFKFLKSDGFLLVTTPTPPLDGRYESRVWPTDHKQEFTLDELYGLITNGFKIIKQIGWSLEEREFNKLLEENIKCMNLYTKLKGAFPESYIRAIIACMAPIEYNRQVLLICKKRRIANGKFKINA